MQPIYDPSGALELQNKVAQNEYTPLTAMKTNRKSICLSVILSTLEEEKYLGQTRWALSDFVDKSQRAYYFSMNYFDEFLYIKAQTNGQVLTASLETTNPWNKSKLLKF